MKKFRWFAVLAAAVCAFAFCGCKSQGRESGNYYDAEEKEFLQTSFFKYAVISSETLGVMGNSAPKDEDKTFLSVEVKFKNVFEKAIPMSIYDFELQWDNGNSVTYAENKFTDSQIPDEWEMKLDETVSGNMVFVVPKDAESFSLVYKEKWDDGFEGNTYAIEFSLE